MSSLRYDTIKPFRKNKDITPQTGFGECMRSNPATNKCPAWHGLIEVGKYYTDIQYIPSDSPVFPKLNIFAQTGEDETQNLYDENMDQEITDKWIDEWDANEEQYSKNDVLYRVNKHGWRADNIVKSQGENAVMFLGDSFTFGVAVANDDVWCSKVATKIGKINWNVGNPGGTNQDIILLFESFIESGYIPSQVVVMWTSPVRKILFNGKKFNNFAEKGNVHDIDDNIDWNDEVSGFIADLSFADTVTKRAWSLMADNQMWFDFYMQRQSLLHLCARLGIKLTEMHYKRDTSIFCHNIDGKTPLGKHEFPNNRVEGNDNLTTPNHYGRDGTHWGSDSHNEAYKTCIKLLNS
jgi:hypothetical protein